MMSVMVLLIGDFCVIQNAFSQTEDEMKAVLQGIHEAHNGHDMDAYLTLLTDDFTFDAVLIPFPDPLDREQFKALFNEIFVANPDSYVDDGFILTADNILLQEHNMGGTSVNEFRGVPPHGEKFVWPHIDVLEFEGSKVKKYTSYGDYTGYLSHLFPEPAPLELKPSFTLPSPEPSGLTPLEIVIETDALWNSKDMNSYSKYFAADATMFIAPLGVPLDRDAYIAAQDIYIFAFPNRTLKTIRRIDFGNGWIVSEIVFTGTNDGPFLGIPATGRPFEIRGINLTHVNEQGLITVLNNYYDNLILLAQLGLLPDLSNEGVIDDIQSVNNAIQDGLNAHNLDLVMPYLADDFTAKHSWDTKIRDAQMFKEGWENTLTAFPDQIFLEGLVLAKDGILIQETGVHGTHIGEWNGLPPTGEKGNPWMYLNVWDYEGLKMKQLMMYGDMQSILINAKIMPPPEMPPLIPSFTVPAPEPNGLTPLDAANEAFARWSAHDLPSWLKTFSSDADIFINILGRRITREELAALFELNFAGFPDVSAERIRTTYFGDGWILNESLFRGTQTGPWFGIPPTGRVYQGLKVAEITHYNSEGLCTYFHAYYDNITILYSRA